MNDKELEVIEQILKLISEQLKAGSKFEKKWFTVLNELNRLLDCVVLEVIQENRDDEESYFKRRLEQLKIHINGDLNVSIAAFDQFNKYLDLYERLRFTKEQVVMLIERDLEVIHTPKPVTTDDLRRIQLELQVENQKKKKGE